MWSVYVNTKLEYIEWLLKLTEYMIDMKQDEKGENMKELTKYNAVI